MAFFGTVLLFFALAGCNGIDFAARDEVDSDLLPSPLDMGTSHTDEFDQEDQPRVDILFVVDNSGSMEDEQEEMGNRFPDFIAGLGDIDWQIGITTTDLSPSGEQGSLIEFASGEIVLTSSSSVGSRDAEDLFLETVQMGADGHWNERPLKAIYEAINLRDEDNSGFFRDETNLAVVVLSDEDECSNGDCDGEKNDGILAENPEYVLNAFNDISDWGTKQLRSYGIIIEQDDAACLEEQGLQVPGSGGSFFGESVADLVRLTGGITGSICDATFSKSLKRISQDVKDLALSFNLTHEPRIDSVTVTITPTTITPTSTVTWRVDYSGKRIIFDEPPPANVHIKVDYIYD